MSAQLRLVQFSNIPDCGSSRLTARPAPLPALERNVLVQRGVGKQRDPAKPRLAHARADTVDEGKLPDRRKDRPLDHQLPDLEEDRLAPRAIELAGLLLVERVDVRVAAVARSSLVSTQDAPRSGAPPAHEALVHDEMFASAGSVK